MLRRFLVATALVAAALVAAHRWPDALAEDAIKLSGLKVESIAPQGPVGLRVNLVILGDGYTKEDLGAGGAFRVDVERLVKNFFSKEPFASHRELFNVHVVPVASIDRGADDSPDKPVKKTAFGSAYNVTGIARLLAPQKEDAVAEAAKNAPRADVIIVLVNDSRFGGSGGKNGDIPSPVCSKESTAFLTAIHELGHSWANLGDEYVDEASAPKYAMPDEGDLPFPNLQLAKLVDTSSNDSLARTLKWGGFFRRAGAFEALGTGWHEGGYYRAKGIYRPARTCAMQTEAGGGVFCYVCEAEMRRAIMRVCGRGPLGGFAGVAVPEAKGAAAGAWEHYQAGRFAKVVAELKRIETPKLAEKDKADVEALRKALQESADAGLAKLDGFVTAKDTKAAKEYLGLMSEAFKGTEWAKSVELRKKSVR
jgi:hypothetical protein